jgi:chaperonin GroEL
MKGLLPFLECSSAAKRPLLIISDALEGDALQTLILNRIKGILDVTAIKSPGFSLNKRDNLKDVAILTGGVFLSEEEGFELESVNPNMALDLLGECEKLTVVHNKTTIINGLGNKEEIASRVENLKLVIDNKDNESEKLLLKESILSEISEPK